MSIEAAVADGTSARAGLKLDNVVGFLSVHALAALAIWHQLFSWSGVAVFIVGTYVFGVLGINLGFHRLLTHRSFSCPLWLEHLLAILGTCALQFSPAFWVAVHRRHHHHSDDTLDPHSPVRSVLWAHFGWLLARGPDMRSSVMINRYARELLRDPFYVALDHNKGWIQVGFAVWLMLFVAGFGVALLQHSTFAQAFRFGAGLFIWGGALRTVVVWHTTWSVNSLAHVWGYRNYATNDDSRNNALVALLAGGEGWHNNHHADPNAARHGHRWWEFDLTWWTLSALAAMGLAHDIKLPSTTLAEPDDALC